MQSKLMCRRSAASDYLLQKWGVSCKPATLAKLATVGGGPRFSHFGRWPMYDLQDLDHWVESRTSHSKVSTSDIFSSTAILEGGK